MSIETTEDVMKKNRKLTVTLIVICQSFQAVSIGGIALLLPLIRQDLGLDFYSGGQPGSGNYTGLCPDADPGRLSC